MDLILIGFIMQCDNLIHFTFGPSHSRNEGSEVVYASYGIVEIFVMYFHHLAEMVLGNPIVMNYFHFEAVSEVCLSFLANYPIVLHLNLLRQL